MIADTMIKGYLFTDKSIFKRTYGYKQSASKYPFIKMYNAKRVAVGVKIYRLQFSLPRHMDESQFIKV